MRQELICAIGVLAFTAACGTAAEEKGQVTPHTKPVIATATETSLIADFESRVQAYHDLRDKVDEGAAHQTKTDDPAKLKAQRQALAANLMKARADAKPGDIFTPDIQALFRKLLKPAVSEPSPADARANKNAIKEETPKVELKVNTPYPEGEPLSTVPPDVLMQLPKLPTNMEYRFVGKHLILYDARANLIIDFILNGIQ